MYALDLTVLTKGIFADVPLLGGLFAREREGGGFEG
jgi:hypothetical protein